MTGKRRKGRDPRPVPPPPQPAAPPQPNAPAAPPASPLVSQRPLTRRQLRMERRKRRQRVGVMGIAGLVVVAIVIVAAVAFGVHKAVSSGNHSAPQTQETVLLQIQGADRTALGTALLAHGPSSGNGVELLVPSQLITDVCGVGQVTFGQTLAAPNGAAVSRQAVSAALGGVIVDGSWVMSEGAFADLINAVGGVTVDVDVNVIAHDSNGTSKIVLQPGSQHLNGAQAVEFATYQASTNESAAAQLSRLQLVVDAMVRALPRTTAQTETLLHNLGPAAASTLGVPRLAALLVGLADDSRQTGGVLASDLPTNLVDSGGPPTYTVDTEQTAQLVESAFKASLPPVSKGEKISVELRNGVGTPGLDATACPKLAKAGLVYAGQGNAGSFSNQPSEVQINSDSPADIAQGRTVAKALGLPASDVVEAQFGQDTADVIVILGRDYRP